MDIKECYKLPYLISGMGLIMARALRIESEGAFYLITSRGNDRKKIFFSKTD
jgi:hypothetical protein